MNYFFRPTPVVTLGHDRGMDRVPLRKSPSGMMHGWPMLSGAPSRSMGLQGDPWLVRSGTMSTFGTLGNEPCRKDCAGCAHPCGMQGMGQDSTDFYSGAFASPSIPASIDTSGFDYSGAFATPNIPAAIDTSFGAAPNLFSSSFPAPGLLPVVTSAPAPALPGTQPINVPQATSVLQSALNLANAAVKPTTATVTLPPVGVNPNIPPAGSLSSFFSGSTLIAGVPNATVIFGGLAALVLVGVLMGGKK